MRLHPPEPQHGPWQPVGGGIERDIVVEGRSRAEAEAFWDERVAVEDPFLARERPWERADLVINGTPDQASDYVLVTPGRAAGRRPR
ncbi:MAG: hypothetical protein LWW86_07535 [Micrococcales bacterium]|nr:hypothetical protein [Micrococcales bacterium]